METKTFWIICLCASVDEDDDDNDDNSIYTAKCILLYCVSLMFAALIVW